MFPHTLTLFLWIGFYNFTQQAMEFQKEVLGWLDEATLYHAKQQQVNPSDDDDFCFDELFFPGEGKEKGGVDSGFLDIPDVSDILDGDGWLNEKIDLSILDATFQDCLTTNSIDHEKFETSAELTSFIDTNYLDNTFLPFETSSPVPTETISEVQNCPSTSRAFFIPSELASPLHILPEIGLQLPSSPAESSCSVFSSQRDVSSPSHSDGNVSDVSEATNGSESSSPPPSPDAVCVQVLTVSGQDYAWSSAASPRKQASRKSVKAAAQPYSLAPFQMKKEFRRERKKVQNKEAAARYRTKKREQDKVLGGEVADLEEKQESLQSQHDSLKAEIKYLKSLMREMFKARGLLK